MLTIPSLMVLLHCMMVILRQMKKFPVDLMNCLFYNTNSKPIFVFLRLFFLGKTIFDIFAFLLMEPFSIYTSCRTTFLSNFSLLKGLRRD